MQFKHVVIEIALFLENSAKVMQKSIVLALFLKNIAKTMKK